PEPVVASYRTLFARFPDDLAIGLKLMRWQLNAGANDDARRTLEALRKLPGGDGAEVDRHAARLLPQGSGADGVEPRIAALEQVRAKAQAAGERLIVASVSLDLSGWYQRRGDAALARTAAQEARSIFQAAGDRDGVVQTMTAEAEI